MSSKSVEKAIEDAKKKAKHRNFSQTWDLIVNLKNIDLSKAENRFAIQAHMPHPLTCGKRSRICIITNMASPEALESIAGVETVKMINEATLKAMSKPDLKKLANGFTWFLVEAPLMLKVGKIIGPVLGPRGKQPRPFPPGTDLAALVKETESKISLKVKSPVIHLPVGKEGDDPGDIRDNIEAVVEGIEKALPKGSHQLGSRWIKLTMGPALKFS